MSDLLQPTAPFNRQDRYFVLKNKDLDATITEDEQHFLNTIALKIDRSRYARGKPALECVVIESTKPEYEQVWKLVEKRLTK